MLGTHAKNGRHPMDGWSAVPRQRAIGTDIRHISPVAMVLSPMNTRMPVIIMAVCSARRVYVLHIQTAGSAFVGQYIVQ